MRIEPECIGCLLNQILSAFKTLKPNVDKELVIKTQQQLMQHMLEIDLNEYTAPLIGKYLYNLVGNALGMEDPYKDLKRKYNNLALKYYEEVKHIIANSSDPLFEAIGASALGNTVDFASQHKIELIKDLRAFTPDNFKINDYKSFKHDLEKTEKLVIIGDNTGEIVLDKVLIETIRKLYPNKEIEYAVRSTSTINDATLQDAKYIGLTDIVKVIESSPAPGIDFSNISNELETYLNKNQSLVLSKGQGNFETLHSVQLGNKKIYYLLKAKCNLMERIFNVDLGSLIFKKKTDGP
jgi:uncharacterized protein with ATP-grasp and redox domains